MINLKTIPFILLLLLSSISSTGQKDTTDYFLPTWTIKPSFVGRSHPFHPSSGLDVEVKLNYRYSIQAGLHYLRPEECFPNHFTSCSVRESGGKMRAEVRRYFFPKPNRSLHGLYSSLECYVAKTRSRIANNDSYTLPDSLGGGGPYPYTESITQREIKASGIIAQIGWQGATFRFGIEPLVGLAIYHEWRMDETEGLIEKTNAVHIEPDFGFRIILLLGDRLHPKKQKPSEPKSAATR